MKCAIWYWRHHSITYALARGDRLPRRDQSAGDAATPALLVRPTRAEAQLAVIKRLYERAEITPVAAQHWKLTAQRASMSADLAAIKETNS